jgi:hypothetical protein
MSGGKEILHLFLPCVNGPAINTRGDTKMYNYDNKSLNYGANIFKELMITIS